MTEHRLHRDPERRIIAGVCAGIADYLGVEPIVIRLAALVGIIAFTLPTGAAYIVLALALPLRPAAHYTSPDEARFWRGVATNPAETVREVAARLARIDRRTMRMEAAVTSSDFDLRRKFREL